MDISFDRMLGIIGIGLGILGIIIGVGVAIAMDPKSKGELVFSIGCFIFSGLVLCLTIGAWGFLTTTSLTKRVLISFSAFAVICVSMVEASRWANGRYERSGTEKKPYKTETAISSTDNTAKTPLEKSAKRERLPEQPKSPFHISAGPAMRTPKRDSYGELIAAFNKEGRYTVIPLNLSIYLRITNLQSTRCIIEKYNVEIKTENGEWIKLIRIDGRAYSLFVVTPPNLSNADLVQADPLDAALAHKQLEVRENVEGWAFFEYPSKFANAQFSQTYRVTVSDNAGVTFRSPELTPGNDHLVKAYKVRSSVPQGKRPI